MMRIKLALITIACAITSCSSSQAQPNSESATVELNSQTPVSAVVEAPAAIAVSQPVEPVAPLNEISKSSTDSVSKYQCSSTSNHLFLDNATTKNNYGNPIYVLRLCIEGKEQKSYQIVTGRSFTQLRNRNQSGTHSPLPNGKYRISTGLTQGTLVEVGKVSGLNVSQPFLPISPMFGTGRSALGIHVDPSYNKDPKEDGTSGCIGLTNPADFKSLWSDIKNYQIRNLEVAINTKASDHPNVARQK